MMKPVTVHIIEDGGETIIFSSDLIIS